MTEKYVKGDWNSEHCEIWFDDEYFGDVRTKDSDKFVELLNMLHEQYIDEFSLRETLQQDLQRIEAENEQLKAILKANGIKPYSKYGHYEVIE